MSRLDRRLLMLWGGLSALAAANVFLGGPLLLIEILCLLLIVTAPVALLLVGALTLWLYLTATLAIYVGLRALRIGQPAWRLLLLAVVAAVAIGFAVPLAVNRAIDRRVRAELAGDGGSVPTIPRGVSVTHLVDDRLVPPGGACGDECQRFLFSGTARSYTTGPLSALPVLARSARPLMRHGIVAAGGRPCGRHLLSIAYAEPEDVGALFPRPALWDKLDELQDRGLCLRSEPTRDGRSDYILVEHYALPPPARPLFDLGLIPVRVGLRRAILRRDGDAFRPVLRRTVLEVAHLLAPLMLAPPGGLDEYVPGRWERRGTQRIGDYGIGMARWATNDFRVTGLGYLAPARLHPSTSAGSAPR